MPQSQTTPVQTPIAIETSSRWVRRLTPVVQIVLGSMLIAACARVQVLTEAWIVPVTLQTLAVLVIGAVFGPVVGVATILAYIAEGAAGLPVFSTAPFAGPAVIGGISGGYLFGFVLAAGFTGIASQRELTRRLLPCSAVMIGATILILLSGATWISILDNPRTGFIAGFLLYLPTGVLKSVLAALIVTQIARTNSR